MASASPQRTGSSSGSDCIVIDERKRKRMESNRESARRSRMKKQKQMAESIGQVTQLKNENSELVARINSNTQNYIEVESRNNVLRAQFIELTDRLRSLNSVLQVVEEVSGLALDIPEIPDIFIRQPWQNPCPIQGVLTSADMFQC